MNANIDYIEKARTDHHKALERLYQGRELKNGKALWRSLRLVEAAASRGATAYCNGEKFTLYGKTYDFHSDGAEAWERLVPIIASKVEKILGALPDGFFVNGDPRGYALKIDPDKATVPPGMHTDWGRNGILAPLID